MTASEIGTMDLSIVIVNHNHHPVIERCLESLYSLPDQATFEVALIDNASTDGTAEWAAGRYPRLTVRRNPICRGFAANVNAGIRTLGRSRYALLLNPDVICIPGLLDRLVAFMSEHPAAGVAAPQLYYPDGSLQSNGRRFPTPPTLALRALRVDAVWRSPRLRRYLMDGERPPVSEVGWVTGAALLARRTAMESVGLLDERYFLYWEDMDWCYRMRRAGWSVCRVPEARAIHLERREGVRRPFSRAGRAQLAGAIRFFRKFGWNPGKAA